MVATTTIISGGYIKHAEVTQRHYGNPSSIHGFGRDANKDAQKSTEQTLPEYFL